MPFSYPSMIWRRSATVMVPARTERSTSWRKRSIMSLGFELDVREHIGDGITFDLVGELQYAGFVDAHADDVGVAEEVVEVAEGFLIGPDEEDADDVVLVRLEAVQRQDFGDAAHVDEAVDLAVAVAGEVGEVAGAVGLLLSAGGWA
jgi:hypothetical protein